MAGLKYTRSRRATLPEGIGRKDISEAIDSLNRKLEMMDEDEGAA